MRVRTGMLFGLGAVGLMVAGLAMAEGDAGGGAASSPIPQGSTDLDVKTWTWKANATLVGDVVTFSANYGTWGTGWGSGDDMTEGGLDVTNIESFTFKIKEPKKGKFYVTYCNLTEDPKWSADDGDAKPTWVSIGSYKEITDVMDATTAEGTAAGAVNQELATYTVTLDATKVATHPKVKKIGYQNFEDDQTIELVAAYYTPKASDGDDADDDDDDTPATPFVQPDHTQLIPLSDLSVNDNSCDYDATTGALEIKKDLAQLITNGWWFSIPSGTTPKSVTVAFDKAVKADLGILAMRNGSQEVKAPAEADLTVDQKTAATTVSFDIPEGVDVIKMLNIKLDKAQKVNIKGVYISYERELQFNPGLSAKVVAGTYDLGSAKVMEGQDDLTGDYNLTVKAGETALTEASGKYSWTAELKQDGTKNDVKLTAEAQLKTGGTEATKLTSKPVTVSVMPKPTADEPSKQNVDWSNFDVSELFAPETEIEIAAPVVTLDVADAAVTPGAVTYEIYAGSDKDNDLTKLTKLTEQVASASGKLTWTPDVTSSGKEFTADEKTAGFRAYTLVALVAPAGTPTGTAPDQKYPYLATKDVKVIKVNTRYAVKIKYDLAAVTLAADDLEWKPGTHDVATIDGTVTVNGVDKTNDAKALIHYINVSTGEDITAKLASASGAKYEFPTLYDGAFLHQVKAQIIDPDKVFSGESPVATFKTPRKAFDATKTGSDNADVMGSFWDATGTFLDITKWYQTQVIEKASYWQNDAITLAGGYSGDWGVGQWGPNFGNNVERWWGDGTEGYYQDIRTTFEDLSTSIRVMNNDLNSEYYAATKTAVTPTTNITKEGIDSKDGKLYPGFAVVKLCLQSEADDIAGATMGKMLLVKKLTYFAKELDVDYENLIHFNQLPTEASKLVGAKLRFTFGFTKIDASKEMVPNQYNVCADLRKPGATEAGQTICKGKSADDQVWEMYLDDALPYMDGDGDAKAMYIDVYGEHEDMNMKCALKKVELLVTDDATTVDNTKVIKQRHNLTWEPATDDAWGAKDDDGAYSVAKGTKFLENAVYNTATSTDTPKPTIKYQIKSGDDWTDVTTTDPFKNATDEVATVTIRAYVATDSEGDTKLGENSVEHTFKLMAGNLSALGVVNAASDVVGVEFYNLEGQKVNANAKGLLLRVETLSNGKTQATKVLVK